MNRKQNRAAQSKAGKKKNADVAAPTVSHLLGEMTWLLTQSPLHKAFMAPSEGFFVEPR